MKLHRYGWILALPIAACAIGFSGCAAETSNDADESPSVEAAPPAEAIEAEIDTAEDAAEAIDTPAVDAAPPADAAEEAETTDEAEEAKTEPAEE